MQSLDDLLTEPDEETPFIIDGVMPRGARVTLTAPQKAGKTTTTGNVIRSLVDGDKFLDHFEVHERKHGIVLIDNELSKNMLRSWLRQHRIVNTAAVATVSLRGRVSSFDILDDRIRDIWAKRLRDLGCDYLILDCLRPVLDALGLDENRDCGKFLVAFDALLHDAGVPDALVNDHMGHGQERARGDSRKQDWPDALWHLVKEDADNPMSPVYFRAHGRDVHVPEGRLDFDPATRHLTYVSGSRKTAKAQAALSDVLRVIGDDAKEGSPGLSGRDTRNRRDERRAYPEGGP